MMRTFIFFRITKNTMKTQRIQGKNALCSLCLHCVLCDTQKLYRLSLNSVSPFTSQEKPNATNAIVSNTKVGLYSFIFSYQSSTKLISAIPVIDNTITQPQI